MRTGLRMQPVGVLPVTNHVSNGVPHFGSQSGASTPEILENRKTLANAKKMDPHFVSSDGHPSPLAQAQWTASHHQAELKLMRGIFSFFFGMVGLCGGLGYYGQSQARKDLTQLETTTGSKPLAKVDDVLSSHITGPDFHKAMRGVSSLQDGKLQAGVSLGVFLPLAMLLYGYGSSKERKKIKEALQLAKLLSASMVQVKAQEDPISKRLSAHLTQRIDEDAERFSQRLKSLYDQKEEVRPHFDEVFGSRESLPSGAEVKQLFEYYAFLKVNSNESSLGWQGNAPLPETEYLEKVYSLLRTGLALGELLDFAQHKKNAPFEQSFNEALVEPVAAMELSVIREVEQVKTLLEKDIEIEKHIALARRALVRSGLSILDRSQETQEVQKIIEGFKTQQGKIAVALSQKAAPVTESEALLLGINDSLQELISGLHVALALNTSPGFEEDVLGATTLPGGSPSDLLEQLQQRQHVQPAVIQTAASGG